MCITSGKKENDSVMHVIEHEVLCQTSFSLLHFSSSKIHEC